MTRYCSRIFVLCLTLILLVACDRGEDAAPTPNVEATVAAAVAATATAQAQMQASIDAAVQATSTAMAAAAALTPTPTPIVITNTQIVTNTVTESVTEVVYVPQEVYVTMSEEELEALIDEAVEQAVDATDASAEAAAAAAADNTVTSEEAESLDVYIHLAEESIAYAEDLLATYGQLYVDNSDEMVAALVAIEQELATLNESAASMAASLEEISATLDAGLTLAEESIAQLESAAAEALLTADQVQAQSQAWQSTLQTQKDLIKEAQAAAQGQPTDFVALIEDIQPQQMAGDLPAALQMTHSFAEMAQHALSDGQIDANEMMAIAQAGANASAGLKAFGGPQLQGLAGSIDGITTALAHHNLPAAQQGLAGLNTQIPTLDSAPAIPVRPGNPVNIQPPAGGGRRP